MSDNPEIRFEGIGVSPGIAFGRIHVVREDVDEVVRYQIAPSQVTDEIGRFEAGLIQTRMQILEMQQRIAESIGAKDAAIFDAHLLVVEDRTLIDEVLRKLKTDLCNVEWAFQEVATRYAETLSKIDDPYLRERALDIQDVTKRVIRNLQGKAPKAFLSLSQPHFARRDSVAFSQYSGGTRSARYHCKGRNRSARSCRWERWLVDRQSDAGNAGVLQAN